MSNNEDMPEVLSSLKENTNEIIGDSSAQLIEPLPKKMTIVFCIPGNSFSNEFLRCWTELFAYCITNNITPILSTTYCSNVFFVRNKCLLGNNLNGIHQKPFQGQIDYDYVMWIDSDQVFSVDMFKRLLAHQKDIVSGMYMMSNLKHLAVVPKMDADYFVKNGSFEFLSRESLIEWKKENTESSLMDVDYCGMGFMLIKRGVLETLEYPWFQPKLTTIQDMCGNIIVQDYNSEDVYLCKTLKDKGYQILVDTDVLVGHEKAIVL